MKMIGRLNSKYAQRLEDLKLCHLINSINFSIPLGEWRVSFLILATRQEYRELYEINLVSLFSLLFLLELPEVSPSLTFLSNNFPALAL